MTEIRKVVTIVEEVRADGDRVATEPAIRAAAVGVVRNPWAGRGYVDDLRDEVERLSPRLAQELAARLSRALGGPGAIEAYGKAAIIGLGGEIEHGAALIHTPFLGDVYRYLVGGESVIAFAEIRGSAGCAVSVPMWHKLQNTRRSHYQTMEIRVGDAPRDDEIAVVLAAAAGGRPFARIGDRTTDATLDPREVLA